MVFTDHFRQQLKSHIKPGSRVAELYHGEKEDILETLAGLVTDKGVVYGVDLLNPFESHENMQRLRRMPNVQLLKFSIPPLPSQATSLDAVVIREFVWTYPGPEKSKENPDTYKAIDGSMNVGGYLILHLNDAESRREIFFPKYVQTVDRQLRHFRLTYHFRDVLIYRKVRSASLR